MKRIYISAFLALAGLQATAQDITISKAYFKQGDDMSWAKPEMDDASWGEIDITKRWNDQGFPQNARAYGWYRIHVNLPKNVLNSADQQNAIILNLPKADDVDECYLNGKLIGSTGRMPTNPAGYFGAVNDVRNYVVDIKNDGVRLDEDNVIAVRVYNRGGGGGLFNNPLTITCPKAADGLSMRLTDTNVGQYHYDIEVNNAYMTATAGTLDITIIDRETGVKVKSLSKKLSLKRNNPVRVTIPYNMDRMYQLTATYTDAKTGKVLTESRQLKYVLTPTAPTTPRFNGAPVWGVRPGSPVIYRFPVSGEKPMKFTCGNLPAGLQLTESGVLSGKIDCAGDLTFTVTAENAKGKSQQEFTLKVGDDMIGQTPPMGWNSWNCWGLTVTQEKVISSAQALIDKGLADYGYSYINIDDGWEAAERNPDGTLDANEKFPSMKELVDWLHERGLKFGIYSAPGATTCGGYLGSLGYEKEDAEVWNKWGVDYLKYDWCSYENVRVQENDYGYASCIRPYLLMQKFLRQQPRDIFYSLGPLGGTQVYLWGLYCDGNSWRTAQDINDTWKSIYDVGFRQQLGKSQYSSIGHWNDPDMLVVGKVGYGLGENTNGLRETRLTPDEQYTHITLWTLVSSNMLIGCDIAQMDDFTLGLLCNNEVNAINQDLLGKQADRVLKEGDIEVWRRPLADGAIAVGVFNVGDEDQQVDMKSLLYGQKPTITIRDLWRQKNLSPSELNCIIPMHGCRFLKVMF
ncbi:MAG: putative Ig domain-containing protein [Bacteroidaceae bacterium]|nr:putative Ig domain-containing protein [Bacteroidaceae bacterium]